MRGGPELAAELQAFVRKHLARYKYPRAVEFMTALPRTETGKIQRFKLRDLELERAAGEPAFYRFVPLSLRVHGLVTSRQE